MDYDYKTYSPYTPYAAKKIPKHGRSASTGREIVHSSSYQSYSPAPRFKFNFTTDRKHKALLSSISPKPIKTLGTRKVSLNVSTGSNSHDLFATLVQENDDWKLSLAKNSDVMILNNHAWEKLEYRKDQIVNRYPNMCQLGRKDVFSRIVNLTEHFN